MPNNSLANLQGGRYLAKLYNTDSIQATFQQKIINAINKIGTTIGVNPVGNVQPPPPIDNINVTTSGELVHVTLNHNKPINKGINYFLEISNNPNFTAPLVQHLGTSRSPAPFMLPTKTGAGDTQKYYMRAYPQYQGSDPGEPTVFGGKLNPASITLSGSTEMDLLPSTGSGTASPTGQQAGQGFGKQQTSQGSTGRQASIPEVVAQQNIG